MTRTSAPKIRKAVFPVAGLGTRFLPATKSMPKEMLPVVDKPLIHYAVEEAKAAGIEEFIFVTGKGKTAIEDYFDNHYELEHVLRQRGKLELLDEIMQSLPKPEQIAYVRQSEQLGLGHAVWCARNLVGQEPFAVLLCDVLVKGKVSCTAQMVDAHNRVGGATMISVEEIPLQKSSKYGVVDVVNRQGEAGAKNLFKIKGMVEKPQPEKAPSNLAVTGRYIIYPEVFEHLDKQQRGASNEIQLTDALAAMLQQHPMYAFQYDGIRYDCGDKAGFLEANIAYALDRPDLREDALRILEQYRTLSRQVA